MSKQDKTVIPGVILRKLKNGNKSLRFACMINGRRFSKTCDMPVDLMIDPRTGRATADLRAEYAVWVEQCSHQVGRVMRFGLKIPTIEELIATYKKIAIIRSCDPNYKRPSARAIDTAVKNFGHCVAASGLDYERPYSALMQTDMIRRIFTVLSERMKGVSAYSYVTALQTVTARWTIVKYKDLGFKVDPPVMPDFGNAKRPPEYKMLSTQLKAKIAEWYTSLAANEDRQLYLAASIVAQLAVRPNDVARLTAENFQPGDDGYTHLVYRPHKTIESSNRRVDWPIYPALWELIRSVAGERLDAGKKLLSGSARTTFDKLNKSMREACDMQEWNKAVYELRKLCVDTVRREQGVDAAVALSGDRRETIDRYYSDPYKLAGVTPKPVMAMV